MIGFCADKGSPGATTAALAVAAGWPIPAIVASADPYGDDLPLRLTVQGQVLADRETILTVATAARTSEDPGLVDRYAQRLNEQVSVVPGPVPAELASTVPGWEPLAGALARSRRPVMADLGRIHASSPVLPVAAAADVLVAVCRGERASVIRLRERLARLVPAIANLRGAAPRVMPLVVTKSRFGSADVADVRQALAETPAGPFVVDGGFLALDEPAVGRLLAGEDPKGRLAKSALMKSALTVAGQLADLTGAPTAEETTEPGAEAAAEGPAGVLAGRANFQRDTRGEGGYV